MKPPLSSSIPECYKLLFNSIPVRSKGQTEKTYVFAVVILNHQKG